MNVRSAATTDLKGMVELLSTAGLPVQGVEDHLPGFLVSEAEGVLCGAVGLERYGAEALLRSLVVSATHRGRGLGTRLCDALEERAFAQGVERLYLLTETAELFFKNRGYTAMGRDLAPAAIRATGEFSEVCPDTAVFMMKEHP